MYSSLITRTAAADSRIVTLAKRANPSSMNMPLKATCVPSPVMPIHRAKPAISAAVTQTSSGAAPSFEV